MMNYDHGSGEIDFEDQKFDLSHLEKRVITIKLDEHNSLIAEVTCSSHCYTDEDLSTQTELIINDHFGNRRFFCPKRYTLSLKLHDWLEKCAEKICIKRSTRRGTIHWLIVEDYESGEKISIVFEIEQHKSLKNAVYIMIKSVHAFDRKPPPEPSKNDVAFKVVGPSYAKSDTPPPRAKSKRKRKKSPKTKKTP